MPSVLRGLGHVGPAVEHAVIVARGVNTVAASRRLFHISFTTPSNFGQHTSDYKVSPFSSNPFSPLNALAFISTVLFNVLLRSLESFEG